MFKIRMGVPEMKDFWENLETKVKTQKASKKEAELFKKLIACFKKLSAEPRYPGLCTHDIMEE